MILSVVHRTNKPDGTSVNLGQNGIIHSPAGQMPAGTGPPPVGGCLAELSPDGVHVDIVDGTSQEAPPGIVGEQLPAMVAREGQFMEIAGLLSVPIVCTIWPSRGA